MKKKIIIPVISLVGIALIVLLLFLYFQSQNNTVKLEGSGMYIVKDELILLMDNSTQAQKIATEFDAEVVSCIKETAACTLKFKVNNMSELDAKRAAIMKKYDFIVTYNYTALLK
jgi:hypothetical protein